MGAACCTAKPIDFDGDVNLFHFSLLRNVGKGAFGKVRVVKHKKTNEMYALKYINKARCLKMRAVVNIIQERRLLEEIDHPFIVNMRYAFQDDENLFFALDLMLGGDLRFHLDRHGRLPEEAVRFWLAELGSAVAYLHSKRIVHRDIKPDNILLDVNGHAHLTDFNIAVHFTERPLTGVAGSMAYMAPEVLARRGYAHQCDWWSLGVCMFELLCGRRPFRGQTNDELKNNIKDAAPAWPDHPDGHARHIHPSAKDCLMRMLDRNPSSRLGAHAASAVDELRHQPWMQSADASWDVIQAKRATSPFVPDPNKAHFDATYDLEELLLEDNPLRARERKVQDVSKLSDDLRTLEEKFTNYDFTAMRRRSYYPQSQLVSSITAASSSRPVTPADDEKDYHPHVVGPHPPLPPDPVYVPPRKSRSGDDAVYALPPRKSSEHAYPRGSADEYPPRRSGDNLAPPRRTPRPSTENRRAREDALQRTGY